MTESDEDPFVELLTEMADGRRWALARAEGFDNFVERLAAVIGALEPRRRQAIVMLLFGLAERLVSPEEADEWIGSHDIDSDQAVEAMIAWLRQRRIEGG